MKFGELIHDGSLTLHPLEDKIPQLKDWQNLRGNTEQQLEMWERYGYDIGVVCGAPSDGLEVLDIDQKYAIAGDNLIKRWSDNVIKIGGEAILPRLCVSKTGSGGYHIMYKCPDTDDGNLKLANRGVIGDETGRYKTLIETRGHGGQIKAYPAIKGGYAQIPELTIVERDLLITAARMMNEYIPVGNKVAETANRSAFGTSPLDQYTAEADISVTLDLLLNHGWSIHKEMVSGDHTWYMLTRPGKRSGVSATLGYYQGVFYPWSSEGVFEDNKGYTAAGVLCMLEYDGDYTACARALLSQGYGERKSDEEQRMLIDRIMGRDNVSFTSDETNHVLKGIKSIEQALEEHFDYVRTGKTFKLSDRFKHIQPMMQDISRGQVAAIAGSSGSGKSTVMAQILADYCSVSDTFGLMASLEMPARDVAARSLMEMCDPEDGQDFVSKNKASWRGMTDAEFRKQVVEQYRRMAILDDKYEIDAIMNIAGIYKEHLKQQGKDLALVAIDFQTLLTGGSNVDQQAIIAQKLKVWAKKLDVIVFVLQQFNSTVDKFDIPDTNSISGRRDLYAMLDFSFLMYKSRQNPRRIRIVSSKERFTLESTADLVQVGMRIHSEEYLADDINDAIETLANGNKALRVRRKKDDISQ